MSWMEALEPLVKPREAALDVVTTLLDWRRDSGFGSQPTWGRGWYSQAIPRRMHVRKGSESFRVISGPIICVIVEKVE